MKFQKSVNKMIKQEIIELILKMRFQLESLKNYEDDFHTQKGNKFSFKKTKEIYSIIEKYEKSL